MTTDVSVIDRNSTDPGAPAPERRRRVLVVDDNPELRGMISAVLRERGCDVVECDGSATALWEIAVSDLDAAVIDLIMPDVHGLEFLRELRERPGGEDLPSVIMSSLPPGRTRKRARAEIAAMPRAGFLDKPVTGRVLAEALSALAAQTA